MRQTLGVVVGSIVEGASVTTAAASSSSQKGKPSFCWMYFQLVERNEHDLMLILLYYVELPRNVACVRGQESIYRAWSRQECVCV